MAIHSKSDFAKLCALTSGNLTNYIKRGKVNMGPDGIDDEDLLNRDFLEHRRGRVKNIPTPRNPPPPPEKKLRMIRPDPGKPEDEVPDVPEEDEDDIEIPENGGDNSMYLLHKKKLSAEIRKKHREINLLQLREEKIRGEVIPVDLIKNLFKAHTQSILSAQKDGIEDLLIQISAENRLKGEQLARLRGKMVTILNAGIEKSVAMTRRNLKMIVSAYSLKREAGERG